MRGEPIILGPSRTMPLGGGSTLSDRSYPPFGQLAWLNHPLAGSGLTGIFLGVALGGRPGCQNLLGAVVDIPGHRVLTGAE